MSRAGGSPRNRNVSGQAVGRLLGHAAVSECAFESRAGDLRDLGRLGGQPLVCCPPREERRKTERETVTQGWFY